MIGSLRGRLLDRAASGEVLIEVAGVGYRVQVGAPTLSHLGMVGDEVFLYCHHVQREDAQLLYGFATLDERHTFEALLTAQGVGPAMALGVLCELSADQLRLAVATGDVDGLRRVKGVGAKTAARIVIDLKSRLQLPEGDLAAVAGLATGTGNGSAPTPAGAPAEVRAALSGLGYGPDEIRSVMAVVEVDGEADSATLLRSALRQLAAR